MSAPTIRVLDVVELLASHGAGDLRFSDVVRELGLTQATAHAILTTLCDRGWASRDPVDKTFSLGPALAVVAARTDLARPLAHAARGAALQLSRELGYPASVVERFGDSLVITAFEGGDQPAGAPGDRIRYAPPFGVAFAAWDTDEEQRAWIQRSTATDSTLARRLEELLARTRERGFDVDCTTPALTEAARVVGTLPSDGLPAHVREITERLLVEFTTIGFLPDDASAREARPVATIAAPVFDDRGRVATIVAVHPLQALTRRQIDSIGRRVTGAAGGIRA
ncbi:IclR family transcriptional regulator [Mycobacterium branderi]|uniref:Transcriptional regulator n=1 Tax=Mycobacterium branderi TaxID=43348 RepID=A0A7I7W2E3_9MYCO|nr:helix-turn-helix domain-containing protein [Mycobacterium branderi]MCV7232053.1 helix-turn-helix domain-containing protein [Mycobacterium branderi]ORA32426.1 transcriptional regulator [Mycobacterium branderi]BBZ11300.1 putative transcriptional regulator, IclR family protein [Mycobacterium branderi]